MQIEDQVEELLVDWVQARDRGHEMSAEELCRDCPELVPELQRQIDDLKATDWMFADDDDEDDDFLSLPNFNTQSAKEDDTLEVTTSLPLDELASCITSVGLMTAEQLSSFESGLSSPVDATELARQLVRKKRLTMYQATAICEGKTDGLVYGDYVILDRIGASGMGQVFKARHRRMKRVVALKILPPESVATPNAVERFEREVEAAARLTHPNIVTAHDAREDNGVHYLVMECVEGDDLSSLVKKNGPVSVAKAIDCIKQAAQGLAFAHGEGVVHRDIKPGNLLVDNKGVVKILDMGLARLEQPTNGNGIAVTQVTQDGSVLGTVDYMAPEQALDTKHADARADIYSLGCTMHYLLTGDPVFVGSTLMARMLAHRERDLPSLAEERSGVPAELDAVFKKMVAKEPADRYQTGAELLEALETVQVAEEEVEHEPSVAVETHVDAASKDTSSAALGDTLDLTPKPEEEVPAPKPATVSKGRGILFGGIVAVAALLLGGIYLASVIFRVELKEGIVLVEIGDPDKLVEVTVTKDDEIKIVDPNDGKDVFVTVEAGKNKLTLRKEGFEAETESFSLKSKDGRRVKVSFVPVEEVAASGDVDRDVAEWVLESGGFVTVEDSFKGLTVKDVDRLPRGKFRVTIANLDHTAVGDADMQRIAGLSGIYWLTLHSTNVTDAGLATVAKCGTLKRLNVHNLENVTDRGLVSVSRLSLLESLTLSGSGVSSSGLQHLTQLENLNLLVLQGLTRVGDEGVNHIARIPSLEILNLMGTSVTDDGIKQLAGLNNLKDLALDCTGVTAEGLAVVAGMKDLEVLAIGATGVTDDGLAKLHSLEKLSTLTLTKTTITDGGLDHLAKIKSLKSVDLRNTKITAEGVAKLQKALPDCEIKWDGSVDVDRQVAEWALERGIKLSCHLAYGESVCVTTTDELPKTPFRIHILLLGDPLILPADS